MDIDVAHGPHQGSSRRSTNGCWTCRLRRKKCDEKQPVCDTCATLLITCHNNQNRPEWMDGGHRQEEMAKQLKREVKENASSRLRRWERTIYTDNDNIPAGGHSDRTELGLSATVPQHGADSGTLEISLENIAFGRSDTVLLMFHLDNVLPFLFPFYHPSALDGGKSWILEMMISSPVVRQATLSQSSFFFSLARRDLNCGVVWNTMLTQTKETFELLRQSLEVITASNVSEHLHGAVRIFASIMQVQRFEIAVLSLSNCHAHLKAGLAIFRQLLDNGAEDGEAAGPDVRFQVLMERLGPPTWVLPQNCEQFPSAEQSAFRFSSALLMFDDIIASTVLQEEPILFAYHDSLLGKTEVAEPLVNLEAVIGCHNCVLRLIGEVAVLDAWKQRSRRVGKLNMMHLVHRATVIKDSLDEYLVLLASHPGHAPDSDSELVEVFRQDHWQQAKTPASQTTVVTRIWTHAALLYLFVVVSGWQPASADVRYHVSRVLELLVSEISPPAMLRTMTWPFCVAGCLADPSQEDRLREMVGALQPASVFGTVRKALEIMENVWRNRGAVDSMSRDLAACFREQGDLVLLV